MSRCASPLLRAWLGCWLGACAVEAGDGGEAPLAGLYTPGSTLGASDPSDFPQMRTALGDRCLTPVGDAEGGAADDDAGAPAVAATPGELMLEYSTKSLMGRYAPKNCTAVWIEDAEGAYVATLEVTAGLRRPGLLFWQERACVDQLGPDVMTSATRRDHEQPHSASWSGQDALGRAVADGSYTLWIEVTESDKEPGVVQTFSFEKGPAQVMREVEVDFEGALQQASLAWTPQSAGGTGAGP